MRVHDSLTGAVMLLLGIGLLVGSSGFRVPIGQPYGPGLFPSLLGVGLGVCGIVLIIAGRRHGLPRRAVVLAPWTRSRRARRRALLVPIGILCYVAVAPTFGFVLTATAILSTLMVALDRRLLPSLLVALVSAAAI